METTDLPMACMGVASVGSSLLANKAVNVALDNLALLVKRM
jgi:hypothetical protein